MSEPFPPLEDFRIGLKYSIFALFKDADLSDQQKDKVAEFVTIMLIGDVVNNEQDEAHATDALHNMREMLGAEVPADRTDRVAVIDDIIREMYLLNLDWNAFANFTLTKES